MNIGIFVHSQSGHTSAFGIAVAERLREKGHAVDIELLRPAGPSKPRRANHVHFAKSYDLSQYDTVLIGGPIWGFNASPVALAFVRQIPRLNGKKALCFTTSGTPYAVSGSKRAHRKLAAALEARGATVLEGVAFCWGLRPNKMKMEEAVKRVCEIVLS